MRLRDRCGFVVKAVTMRVAGAAVLSVDAGKTLVLDREAVLASANEAKIAIVGRPLLP